VEFVVPVVFPRKGNKLWPLPADYGEDLTEEGRRAARVNACSIGGRPDLEVASWAYFRHRYLFPTPQGMWYKHGVVRSPNLHYQWVHDWAAYRLSILAAPRSAAKSVIVKEKILKNLLVKPYWETALFLAKQDFVSDALDTFMQQLEQNPRIVEDFGRLKPGRNEGIWNHHQLKLRNGAMLTGLPIMGTSLGKRPHEIIFDDVEKDDSMVVCPTHLVEAFKKLLFNVVFPMAEEGVAIRIIGTLLHRKSFLYWLWETDDPRIEDYWLRDLSAVEVTNPDGTVGDLWTEKMGLEWRERQKAMLGPAAYAAQCMNDPGTEASRILRIHPELNTYWLGGRDEEALTDPFKSGARIITHKVTGYHLGPDGKTREPTVQRVVRPWASAVEKMKRVILVDHAKTTTTSSDFSAVHCIGFENTEESRDTLYSLDLWEGRVRPEELLRQVYLMARTWGATLVGIEEYGLQVEMYERLAMDLPQMFGEGEIPVRVFPIKFPTHYSKSDKIKGLEWRFVQYKIKIPIDREVESEQGTINGVVVNPYGQEPWGLRHQVENFTEDMALLQYDDALDTLSMHLAIGKSRTPHRVDPGPTRLDKVKLLVAGEGDGTNIPVMSGMNAADIPRDALEDLLDRKWEEALQRYRLEPFYDPDIEGMMDEYMHEYAN
jgi:hypothetical protein